MGTALVEYFQEPVIAKSMPVLAGQVAAEIKRHTGVEIAVSEAKVKSWGHKKGGLAAGEVTIACDPTLMHLAKGEKRQIKELREKLRGEKDPAKIKSLNDAIDSLYSRMDADKKRKEDRRQQRDDKAKKDQEAADKEPAKFPATASFKGTLSLAAVDYCDGCDNMKSICKCNPKTASKSDHEDGGKHDPAAKDAGETNVLKQGESKLFKVVAVSSNTNSFGLYGVIMIAQDGEAWKAAHGQLGLPKQGDTLLIDPTAWGASGFEIPEKLPQPPAEVVSEAWGKGKQASSAGRSLQ